MLITPPVWAGLVVVEAPVWAGFAVVVVEALVWVEPEVVVVPPGSGAGDLSLEELSDVAWDCRCCRCR